MLTTGTEGTMFEIANEVFDEVVFTDDDDLKRYNDEQSGVLRDALYGIVEDMISAADKAMVECAQKNKDSFLELVRNRKLVRFWADYDTPNGHISTEYDCESVEELIEWLKDEFAEELDGEPLDETRLSVSW